MSTMNSGTRRFVYGLNVAVTIALAGLVACFVIWAAGRWGGRVDLTSSGRNSISPRTAQLLRGLDTKVTLTGFYTLLAKDLRPNAEKHRDRVRDLLDLYESTGRGNVTVAMIDPQKTPADAAEIRARLVQKPAYKDEAAGHVEALEAFPALNARLGAMIKAEGDSIAALQVADKRFENLAQTAGLDFALKSFMRDAEATQKKIDELRGGAVPRYGAAVQEMRAHLTASQKSLQEIQGFMTGDGPAFQPLSAETKAFLAAAATRYQPILAEIEAMLQKTSDLKNVKLEQITEQLRGDGVLVETEREAVVVPGYEIWRFPRDRMPGSGGDEELEFNGEAAISSAILKLTQKDKAGVVFVRFGGQPMLSMDPAMLQNITQMSQMPRIPFGMARDAMEKENFVTGEWDASTQPDPPALEGVSKTIFVIFPPRPPQPDPRNPRPPMGITPEQKQKVLDAVDKSGMAIFLVDWSAPSQMSPMGGRPYEFADYLSSRWGISPESSTLVLRFIGSQRDTSLMYPELINANGRGIPGLHDKGLAVTEHEITAPLKASPVGLTSAVPIEILPAASRPAGVKIEPIIEAPADADVWAIKDVQRLSADLQQKEGTTRYPEDKAAPFPVAVAASREDGKKVIVVGSESFFADDILQIIGQMMIVGGRIQGVSAFPGNSDLLLNSLHWLSGNTSRIAVGPSVGDVPRLSGLKDQATANVWKTILVGVWPGLALVAGGLVWLMRRR